MVKRFPLADKHFIEGIFVACAETTIIGLRAGNNQTSSSAVAGDALHHGF